MWELILCVSANFLLNFGCGFEKTHLGIMSGDHGQYCEWQNRNMESAVFSLLSSGHQTTLPTSGSLSNK